MKKLTIITTIVSAVIAISSCGGGSTKPAEGQSSPDASKSMVADPSTYDPKRGEGKYTAENLVLSDKLDESMAKPGEEASNVKCTSCHKLTDEKLVGPGWKDVTKRRTPVWLMNFITNPDPMIDKDPEAQAMLELCLVRMPNQNLSDEEARNILEFMRKNDGVK